MWQAQAIVFSYWLTIYGVVYRINTARNKANPTYRTTQGREEGAAPPYLEHEGHLRLGQATEGVAPACAQRRGEGEGEWGARVLRQLGGGGPSNAAGHGGWAAEGRGSGELLGGVNTPARPSCCWVFLPSVTKASRAAAPQTNAHSGVLGLHTGGRHQWAGG